MFMVHMYRGPMVDAYGFERPTDFDYKSYDEFMSHYVHVLARRAGRWATLLDASDDLSLTRKCNSVYFHKLAIYLFYFSTTNNNSAIWS